MSEWLCVRRQLPSLAVRGNNVVIRATIEVLLAAGASLHAPNYRLQTPVHLACKKGHKKAVTLLLGRVPSLVLQTLVQTLRKGSDPVTSGPRTQHAETQTLADSTSAGESTSTSSASLASSSSSVHRSTSSSSSLSTAPATEGPPIAREAARPAAKVRRTQWRTRRYCS